jgi:hypothetical protein
MYLQYGISDDGELVYIDQVSRGGTGLRCPYCAGLLLAKKGLIKAHHFAHAGQTCRQVERDEDTLALPCYDNFNLHLAGRDLAALQAFHREEASGRDLDRLEALGLIKYNEFARNRRGDWELTKKGQIPFGELSLNLFNEFQEPLLVEKHQQLEEAATQVYGKPGIEYATAITDLRLYRAQWRRILSCSLYFLEVQPLELYKIGVTTRDIQDRLAEISADLQQHAGDQDFKITVLGTWSARGNVELYFKHKHAAANSPIGPLTEYFRFEDIAPVIRDLKRMKAKELTSLEEGILRGDMSPLEERLRLEEVEQRRRAAIRVGMRKASARGKHIGRPASSEEAFLAEPKHVAGWEGLQRGLSLRSAAAEAGISVNTLRKIQKLRQKG